jgi:hypothetical protein
MSIGKTNLRLQTDREEIRVCKALARPLEDLELLADGSVICQRLVLSTAHGPNWTVRFHPKFLFLLQVNLVPILLLLSLWRLNYHAAEH